MKQWRVLVVEDHDELRHVTISFLSSRGFDATGAFCAEEMDEWLAHHTVDLVVLDLNLPGEDGLSIARRLRTSLPGLGIVMLTARDKPTDRAKGYEDGADIYLTKPAAHDELLGALNSLTRRLAPSQGKELVWRLDTAQHTLSGGLQSTQLTANEVQLLRALAIAPQRSLAYWQICEALGLEISDSNKAALEVRVVRLRKKLVAIGMVAPVIRSVHKHGYELLVGVQVTE